MCVHNYMCVCACMYVYMHMYVGECVCIHACMCLCVWSRWRVDRFGGGIHVCVEFAINAGQLRMMYTALQNGGDSSAMKQCWN